MGFRFRKRLRITEANGGGEFRHNDGFNRS